MRVRDFDVVAEDFVEADLERGDAGPVPLARLQRSDVLLAAVARGLQVVEVAVVPRFDRVSIIELRRRVLDERARQLFADIGEQIELVRARLEQGGALAAVEPADGARHIRQPQDRIAQGAHLARRRSSQGRASRQALEIAHAVERLAQPLAAAAVTDQHRDRVESCVDRRRVDERRQQPAAQQPAAHRREGAVDDSEQGGAFRVPAGAERLDELEIAPRHLIERQDVTAPHDGGVRQMRQAAGLQLARVAQQRAGGANGRSVVRADAKPIERGDTVGARQVFARQLGVEFPCLARGHCGDGRSDRMIRRNDELAGFVAPERSLDVGRGDDLEDEIARGDVEGSEPGSRAAGIHRHEIVIPVSYEPVVRQHGARRHRLDHRPANDAFGQLGIFDLLTNRDAVPLGDEPPQILGGGFHGDTGERDLRRAAVVA